MKKLEIQAIGCFVCCVGFLLVPTGFMLMFEGYSKTRPCNYFERRCLITHSTTGIVINSAVTRDDFINYFEAKSLIKLNADYDYYCSLLTYAGDNETSAISSLLQVNLNLDINYHDNICSMEPIYVTRVEGYNCAVAGTVFIVTFILFVVFIYLFAKNSDQPLHSANIEASEHVQDNDMLAQQSP